MNEAAIIRDGAGNDRAPSVDKYISRPDEVHFLHGVVETIAPLNKAWFWSATGLVSQMDLTSRTYLCIGGGVTNYQIAGATIDGIYYCLHEDSRCALRRAKMKPI
jgi:histidinol phosphatase-like enzyme